MSAELPDEFYVEAEIAVIPALSFEDAAPVASLLNERLTRVRTSRSSFGPTMAAGPDLAVELIVQVWGAVVVGEILRRFAGLLAEDGYKAIREGVLRLVTKANEQDTSRPWNVGITIGSHHFFFSSPMDDSEFVRRLAAMRQILDSSPDELLDGSRAARPEPGGSGWWWNAEKGLWVPTPGMDEAMRGERK